MQYAFVMVFKKDGFQQIITSKVSLMSADNKNSKPYMHLPNVLTISRILAIPVLLVLYPFDFEITRTLCAIIFLLAAITDFFDGYIARKYELTTTIGAVMDQVADKLLVATCLLLLAYGHATYLALLGILLCRDIFINGLRLIAAEKNHIIEVGTAGKFKTTATMIAIFCLMIPNETFNLNFHAAGLYFLIVAVILAITSGIAYVKEYLEIYESEKQNSN